MPNFSSLARLEVPEKFLWGGGGLHSHFHVKPNRCFVLCWGWGFDNNKLPKLEFYNNTLFHFSNSSLRCIVLAFRPEKKMSTYDFLSLALLAEGLK